jgi:hypothetical protein
MQAAVSADPHLLVRQPSSQRRTPPPLTKACCRPYSSKQRQYPGHGKKVVLRYKVGEGASADNKDEEVTDATTINNAEDGTEQAVEVPQASARTLALSYIMESWHVLSLTSCGHEFFLPEAPTPSVALSCNTHFATPLQRTST